MPVAVDVSVVEALVLVGELPNEPLLLSEPVEPEADADPDALPPPDAPELGRLSATLLRIISANCSGSTSRPCVVTVSWNC